MTDNGSEVPGKFPEKFCRKIPARDQVVRLVQLVHKLACGLAEDPISPSTKGIGKDICSRLPVGIGAAQPTASFLDGYQKRGDEC